MKQTTLRPYGVKPNQNISFPVGTALAVQKYSDKLDFRGIFSRFKKRGGECLSETYANSRTKLAWKCKNRHIWEDHLYRIRHGYWCPVCAKQEKASAALREKEDLLKLAREAPLPEINYWITKKTRRFRF